MKRLRMRHTPMTGAARPHRRGGQPLERDRQGHDPREAHAHKPTHKESLAEPLFRRSKLRCTRHPRSALEKSGIVEDHLGRSFEVKAQEGHGFFRTSCQGRIHELLVFRAHLAFGKGAGR